MINMQKSRGRQSNFNDRRDKKSEKKPSAVTPVIIFQSFICAIIVTAVFTLQFFDKKGYDAVGGYYNALMGIHTTDEYNIGMLNENITFKSVLALLFPENKKENELAGAGGENPYTPSNIFLEKYYISGAAAVPVSGTLTSEFGLRDHPISGKSDFHTGIDIAATSGSAIYCIYPGTVVEIGENSSYGNYIRVKHTDIIETVYCHCSKVCAVEGANIRAGEKIAEVGSTGISTGSHLHLTLLIDGCYADPLTLFYR